MCCVALSLCLLIPGVGLFHIDVSRALRLPHCSKCLGSNACQSVLELWQHEVKPCVVTVAFVGIYRGNDQTPGFLRWVSILVQDCLGHAAFRISLVEVGVVVEVLSSGNLRIQCGGSLLLGQMS